MERKERVFLVGVSDGKRARWEVIQSLEELANLTRTAGGEVVESFIQVRERYDPGMLIGKGKAQELGKLAKNFNIDLLIFDTELSGVQIRNIEAKTGVRVIDRTTLILDIFAKHARTKEAKLQVEMAQLEYRLSRLVGKGLELSRLGGGIGTRGPGEKKLEVDRRRIKERIAVVKKELKKIETSKQVQRKQRRDFYKVCTVGYTNAGKSSLVNALTRAELLTADYLFSTLDSNTSILFLPPNHRILISDTVGFLKRLPHSLIASFRATLAEVLEADLLIHVIDATEEDIESKVNTVEGVLKEIGAEMKPRILVFNKIDRLFNEQKIRLAERYPQALLVSAKEGTGIKELKEYLKNYFFGKD
jgi:GTP-binding protein HflX|uniref:GTPase HflX n=1 Tax=candidate division WOR-3 bacterium TaxID=2052148 RepID=A0A7V3VTM3_UNCW3